MEGKSSSWIAGRYDSGCSIDRVPASNVEEVDKIEKQKVEKKKKVAKSEEEEYLTRKDKNVIKHAQTDENINTEQRKKSKKKTEKDELPADEDNIGSKDKDNIDIKESVKEPVVKGTNESEQELQSTWSSPDWSPTRPTATDGPSAHLGGADDRRPGR